MTDAPMDTTLPSFTTELPAQDNQQIVADQWAKDMDNLRRMPAFLLLKGKLEKWRDKYRHPQFPKDMSYEDVGKEYLLSQQMAAMLKEVLDDLER